MESPRSADSLETVTPEEFLPLDIQATVPPEAWDTVMQHALGWGALASEARRMDSISPLDSRYADPEVQTYLGEQSRIRYQAMVEGTLVQTLAEFGKCPPEVANEVWEACQQVRAEEVYKEEETTRHDVKALTNCITRRVSDEAKPYIHMAATSYDIVGTAEAVRYHDAMKFVIVPRLENLLSTLIQKTEDYADTPQVGRTHGQHGEPITFGFAIAQTVDRLGYSMQKLQERSNELVGKFSGAMGSYNDLAEVVDNPEEFEHELLCSLGVDWAGISTQIPPPDRQVALMDQLAITSGIMSDFANDMRQLQRTEIDEVVEYFDRKNQTGSSAMPHKRNPISFENVCSLNRVAQILAQIGHTNLESEHQRDLRDSASSRFYPELFATVAEMARRLNNTSVKITVNEVQMLANLRLGGGKIASGVLQTALREAGHPAAHDDVRQVMATADEQGISFQEALVAHTDIMARVRTMRAETQRKILEPETNSGLAAVKARDTARHWKKWLADANR